MLFCMRVMVGVIILYDHVHPVGAFAKTSKIDVRTLLVLGTLNPKSIWTLQPHLKYMNVIEL